MSDFRRREVVVNALRGMLGVELRIRTYEESAESRFFPCGPRVDLEVAGLQGELFTHQIAAYLAASPANGRQAPPVVTDALAVSRTAAAEAVALEALMKSSPAYTIAAMDVRSRNRLREIARDYVAAFTDRTPLWRAILGPSREAAGPAEVQPPAEGGRASIIRLCQSVQRADRLTRRLLSPERPLPDETNSARSHLRTAVAEIESGLSALLPEAAENILP